MTRTQDQISDDSESTASARELASLTRLLLSEQEAERERLAKDLHDEIGQCLSAVQFAVGELMHELRERMTDAEKEICTSLVSRISQASEGVRRICMGLRPPMLDDLGVVSAIDWFCTELRQVLIGVDLIQDIRANEDAIPPPIKVAIFRILQEACGNACKHSAAHRLSVLLETDAEGIRLEVADDGIGFDLTSVHRFRGGFGLVSMRERAAMTGGSLAVRSQVGEGTRILAIWPNKESSESTPWRVSNT